MISPSEDFRMKRIFISLGTAPLQADDSGEQITGRMVFRIAADQDMCADLLCCLPFRHCLLCVVGTFAMEIRFESSEQFADIRLIEDRDEIDAGERGDDLRPFLFRLDWPVRAFDAADRPIRVQSDDEQIAVPLGILQVANVPRVQQIEAPVGESDCAAISLSGYNPAAQRLDAEYFGIHPYFPRSLHCNAGSVWMADMSSSRLMVAVPRFMTTRPPL